jgi:hypothetical protein
MREKKQMKRMNVAFMNCVLFRDLICESHGDCSVSLQETQPVVENVIVTILDRYWKPSPFGKCSNLCVFMQFVIAFSLEIGLINSTMPCGISNCEEITAIPQFNCFISGACMLVMIFQSTNRVIRYSI